MEDIKNKLVKQFDFTSRLYDPDKSKEENFEEKRNYLLMKITEDSLAVEDPKRIFRPDTKYFTTSEDIFTGDVGLDAIFIDTHENSAHAVYLKNFKKYTSFFGCEERVFFEALLVKHKAFGGGFTFSIPQCEKELGIKRSKRETIVERFIKLGIIETGQAAIPAEQMKTITQFKVNVKKVVELIPEIYDEEVANLTEIARDIEQRYLEPAPKKQAKLL
jgi:hypothetical protein